MKRLMLLCMVAALVVAVPAYAEVQNVKISGDITLRSVFQSCYDLNGMDDNTSYWPFNLGRNSFARTSESAHSFMSQVGINIDADLTDNVSASIRLLNERDWGPENAPLLANAWTGDWTDNQNDIEIDLAYITLKEMLYSPLTVMIGRQDLWYGDGFIVGSNLRPDAWVVAPEFTDQTAFDSIRAILDYDPWTVNIMYSRISGDDDDMAIWPYIDYESISQFNDNVELWGVNVGYVFDQYNAEAEAYYFGQTIPRNYLGRLVGVVTDVGGANPALEESMNNQAHIFGIRGSFDPIENMNIRGEFAGECGKVNAGAVFPGQSIVDISAFACDVSGSYVWADYSWLPSLGLGYVYMSGEPTPRNGNWNGWINLYRGKYYSAIHEFQGIFYFPDDVGSGGMFMQANTNQHIIMLDGSIQPTDDILLEGRYLHFQAAEVYGQLFNGGDRNRHIGDEVDLRLTYDYTEDVTFGLLNAWFFPGDYFLSATTVNNISAPVFVVPVPEVKSNDIAAEIVGSVTLTF